MKTETAQAPGPARQGAATPPAGLGRRHLQALLLFLAIGLAYSMRINLSVALVSMAEKGRDDGFAVFDWSQSARGVILSSFFWGYVPMQIPGSMLAQRFGPRRFLLGSLACCSLLAMLTPWIVQVAGGFPAMIAIRVIQGVVSGVIFPSTHNMLGRWTPPYERPRFTSLVYGGMSLGTVSAMAGAGWLCSSPLGWPSAFYIPGLAGLTWCVLFFFLSADTPAKCKGISAEELEYIESSLGTSSSTGKSVARVPWKSILTSLPALSIVMAHCGENFGHWMMLTEIPNYMRTSLNYDIKSNGLVSALPYVSLWLATFVVGFVAQHVNQRHWLPLTASRKLFNSLAQWGAGVTLLLLALVPHDSVAAVAMLTTAVTLESCIFAGFYVSHMDLSPNYGGALMGLSNGCASITGIIAPLLVAAMLGDEDEIAGSSWDNVFILTACIYFFGNLVYVILCRAEVQPWNEPDSSPEEKAEGMKMSSQSSTTSATT